jgi:hypothetical protein
MASHIERGKFLATLGGAAASARPLAARALKIASDKTATEIRDEFKSWRDTYKASR